MLALVWKLVGINLIYNFLILRSNTYMFFSLWDILNYMCYTDMDLMTLDISFRNLKKLKCGLWIKSKTRQLVDSSRISKNFT